MSKKIKRLTRKKGGGREGFFSVLTKKISSHIMSPNHNKTCWETHHSNIDIHPSVIIDPISSLKLFNPARKNQIQLSIGEGSHIFSIFNLIRPEAKIKIGKRCQIGHVNFVCVDEIEVGDDVIMGWGITIIDSDNHSPYWEDRRYDVERCRRDYVKTGGFNLSLSHDWSKVSTKKVTVGNKCWIGLGATLLKGVTIGEGAIIGAGSVVTKNIPPWHMAAGNPARVIKKISLKRRK